MNSGFLLKFILIPLILLLLPALPAYAATFNNINTRDELVNAIITANGNGEDDIINITGNIAVDGRGLPQVTSKITINGGGFTLNAENNSRGIVVNSEIAANQITSLGDLTINNWGIVNGNTSGDGGAIAVVNAKLTLNNSTVRGSRARDGAGIRVETTGSYTATVDITNTVIRNNTATGRGGGISAKGNVALTTDRSAVYDNTAGSTGGGLSIVSTNATGTANLRIKNSSIFRNTASGRGGGVYANGNYSTNPEQYLNVNFATITGNTANTSDAVKGGGVYAEGVRFQLRYSIIYGNSNQNCQVASSALMGALLTNIIGTGSSSNCTLNQESGDPRLLPSTSGSLPYYKFYTGSPALNKVSTAFCNSLATVDQAGTTRPVGTACDIGAYEGAGVARPTATATATITPTATATTQATATATATITPTPTATATLVPGQPTATATNTALPGQQPVGGQSPDDGDGDGGGGEDGEDPQERAFVAFPTWTTTPFFRYSPAQSCLTLQPFIVVNNASSGTSCQRVQGMQIGHPDVAAANPSAVVDIWGWVTPNTEVCFRATSGAIKFIDTAALPRTVVDLPVHNQPGGLLCAIINGAGQVALVAGPPAPFASATPPAYRSLSGCMVRTQYILNLRGSPGGETLLHVPFDVTLTALEWTAGWFKVDYLGEHGWIAAEYVEPEGNCG